MNHQNTLLKFVMEGGIHYIAKATKKANGESYALEKGKVNSYYGMACTRIYSTLISYDNKKDEWEETEEGY